MHRVSQVRCCDGTRDMKYRPCDEKGRQRPDEERGVSRRIRPSLRYRKSGKDQARDRQVIRLASKIVLAYLTYFRLVQISCSRWCCRS